MAANTQINPRIKISWSFMASQLVNILGLDLGFRPPSSMRTVFMLPSAMRVAVRSSGCTQIFFVALFEVITMRVNYEGREQTERAL